MLKNIWMAGAMVAAGFASTAAAGENDDHVIKFDDVDWQETGLDGAEVAVLWGSEEGGDAIYAFRIQPGVELPLHTHSNDYWGIAVQGNWVHIDANGTEEVSAQGAYAYIKGGDLHGDRCAGPEVCINVIDFDGARDIAFPEQ